MLKKFFFCKVQYFYFVREVFFSKSFIICYRILFGWENLEFRFFDCVREVGEKAVEQEY